MNFSSTRLIPCAFMAGLAVVSVSAGARSASLLDPANLELHNAKVDTVEYLGRKAVRLTSTSDQDQSAFAVLRGTDFQDGTIEADIAVKITTPPGVRMPGFTGLAFRMKPDGSAYENVYLRPKNALAPDQAMRNHAVQYSSEPEYGWYRLRREWPFIYESYAEIAPESWIHVKIEVAGRTARVFLYGSGQPALVVDGLKGRDLHGGVALWGYAGEESYFSNVRITPATPVPVKNGSDAAGAWVVHITTDTGPFAGTMKLARDGDKVTGTWSGELGNDKPVTGTWRDGHVELSFTGDWPNDRDGAPGPVPAYLEGWFDDASGTGRLHVAGRADGRWEAKRQTEQAEKAP